MSQLQPVKESKSAATIRRRRYMGAPHSANKCQTEDTAGWTEDPEPQLDSIKVGPQILRLLMNSEKTMFMGLVAFRVVNALMLQTSFVPDEYWQSIEVAHKLVFGYGHLTWEWHKGLRSYSYPVMFAAIYKLLAVLRLDYRILLIKLPRVLQAVFAALGDLYLFKFSLKLRNQKVAHWALLCQLTSWFTFYCTTRTLTNSMETVLTTMALFYYPWPGKPRKATWKYISLVGLAVVMRPTAAILWLPLCMWHLVMHRHILWQTIRTFLCVGLALLLISSLIDVIFYGKWVNVYYNFLEFNVLSNLGTFYGSHPWHWYLSQGLAVVLGIHLFPFLLAVRNGLEKTLLAVILWTVLIYSFLEHKEFRFILPVLPLAMHVCGCYLHLVCEMSPDLRPVYPKQFMSRGAFAVLFLVATNLPVALYTSLLHQRGTVDVMKYLHVESFKNDEHLMKVLFLMPCHSTPYYSYLHRNISMEFLPCEPNFQGDPAYVDEADIFYNDPESWLAARYPLPESPTPSHIIMFNVLQPAILPFLEAHGYVDCARFFHSHVPEGRVGSHVIVTCQIEWRISRDGLANVFKHRPPPGPPLPGQGVFSAKKATGQRERTKKSSNEKKARPKMPRNKSSSNS